MKNHSPGDCSLCHASTTNWEVIEYGHENVYECESCHGDQAPQSHYPGSCASCHSNTKNWLDAIYNHAEFKDCLGCHLDDTLTTTMPTWRRGHAPLAIPQILGRGPLQSCGQSQLRQLPAAEPATPLRLELRRLPQHAQLDARPVFIHTSTSNCAHCHIEPQGHYSGSCADCHNVRSWGNIDSSTISAWSAPPAIQPPPGITQATAAPATPWRAGPM